MRLTAKPFIFGTPLLVALGAFALLWVLFAGGGGTGDTLGLKWNVELTQTDAAGNILYSEKLHNTVQANGLEDAMLRLIDAASQGDKLGETDAYDQIVLMDVDDADPSDGILAESFQDLVDGGTGNNSGQSAGGARFNPADGAFSDGITGGDGVGDGTVTLQFLADGEPSAVTQMHLVKAAPEDTQSSRTDIAATDILATIEISVDLADTDTLTITWGIDAD